MFVSDCRSSAVEMLGKREKMLEAAAADSPHNLLQFIQQHVSSPSSSPDDCFNCFSGYNKESITRNPLFGQFREHDMTTKNNLYNLHHKQNNSNHNSNNFCQCI